MRNITVFYAWQSDRPEKINHHFIRIALEAAAKRITEDPTVEAEVRIESDTEGVPGTPPVTETLLAKIASCDIFVPDVSFVARTDGGKLVPNPNVMTEYGYALRAKTYAAMMPVMNTAFGPPDELPFDMGHLRHPIQYRIEPNVSDVERRALRQTLSANLEKKLRLQIAATQPPAPAPTPFPRAIAKDGPARFRVHGEPIGKHWNDMPVGASGAENSVHLADGAAMWLRLMPIADPGRKWPSFDLRKHAIYTGAINLTPLFDANIALLRAEDGVGVYSRTTGGSETTSVAFAFETGEVWAIDTSLLQFNPTMLFAAEIEKVYSKCLGDHARFLSALSLKLPYHWIAGLTGVKDRRLIIPIRQGHMRIPGFLDPECLSDTFNQEGTYDGKQHPSSALRPFFEIIYEKCGVPRPDYLTT